MFDHAKEDRIPVFISADFAQAVFGKEAAFGAGMNLVAGFLESMGQLLGGAGRGGEEMEREAFGRAWTDSRELA